MSCLGNLFGDNCWCVIAIALVILCCCCNN